MHPRSPPTGEALLRRLPAHLLQPALQVSAAIEAAGGAAYLVGGAVRDLLLEKNVSDVDLEVHDLEAPEVAAALSTVGACKAVGRSFGVFKLKIGAQTLDVALPRGAGLAEGGAEGRPGVAVRGEPGVGIEAALRRRDLSINAMAIALPSGALCDPTGGRADLKAGLLRPAEAAGFGDDPLRLLRAARFGARFGFQAAPELLAVAPSLPLTGLPAARVWGELRLILLGPRPAWGLDLLEQLGALPVVMPGLAGVPPAARRATAERLPEALRGLGAEGEALTVALAALYAAAPPEAALADLDRLELHSWAGAPLRAQVLAALPVIGAPASAWAAPALDTTLRRAAERASLRLALRAGHAQTGDPAWAQRAARAEALGVLDGPAPALLTGRALVRLGIPPGEALGRALAALREAQLVGTIRTEAEALAWAQASLAPSPAG